MIKTLCDRCGGDPPVKSVGIVETHDYCEDCQAVYEQYEKKLDNLHTKLAIEWEIGLRLLKEELCIK